VIRHDPRTGTTTAVVPRATQGLFNTRGLLADRNGGGMYITGEGSGQLLRLDLATGQVTLLTNALTGPTGMDYAPDGSLLILEGNAVHKFDAATGVRIGDLVPASSGRIEFGTYLAVIAKPLPPKAAGDRVLQRDTRPLFRQRACRRHRGPRLGSVARMGAHRPHVQRVPRGRRGGESRVPVLPSAFERGLAFLLRSPGECAEVRAKFPSFVYEAADVMFVALPDLTSGQCPPDTQKVYRLWNNRADSNHRYTTDAGRESFDARARLRRGRVRSGRHDHVRGSLIFTSDVRRP
jgi:hypothetical protein